jgi:hypothetical protein
MAEAVTGQGKRSAIRTTTAPKVAGLPDPRPQSVEYSASSSSDGGRNTCARIDANSFCLNYLARKKVSLKLSMTVLDSLPFPRLPINHPVVDRLGRLALRLTCTGPEMTGYWNSMTERGW